MFDWIYDCDRKYEGKWKGKGYINIKNCDNKIIKKKSSN